MRTARCPAKTWQLLETTFPAVSEAAIDANVSQLQVNWLREGEEVVTYFNQIAEIVNEVENAGHSISGIEKKRALLRDRSNAFDVTVEAIMGGTYSYHEAVSKSMVRETRLQESEDNAEKALLKRTQRIGNKYYICRKVRHISRACWQNIKSSGKSKGRESNSNCLCFECGKPGHIVKH